MSAEWWAKKLGRAPAPVVPQRAVQWQNSYPPVGMPPALDPATIAGEDMAEYYRVRQQGYVALPPPSQREGATTCPECGSPRFFRRKWAGKECAPLCTDCGYNGEYFTQSGSILNSVGLRSGGPMQFARSDNPGGESQMDWSHPIAGAH